MWIYIQRIVCCDCSYWNPAESTPKWFRLSVKLTTTSTQVFTYKTTFKKDDIQTVDQSAGSTSNFPEFSRRMNSSKTLGAFKQASKKLTFRKVFFENLINLQRCWCEQSIPFFLCKWKTWTIVFFRWYWEGCWCEKSNRFCLKSNCLQGVIVFLGPVVLGRWSDFEASPGFDQHILTLRQHR